MWVCVGRTAEDTKTKPNLIVVESLLAVCVSGFWLAIVPKHWKVILPPLAWCAFYMAWQPTYCVQLAVADTISKSDQCVWGFLCWTGRLFFFFNTHICVDKASEGRDQLHRAGMRQHNIRLRSETIPLNLRKSEKIKQRREQVENCEGHSEGQRRWNIREQK